MCRNQLLNLFKRDGCIASPLWAEVDVLAVGGRVTVQVPVDVTAKSFKASRMDWDVAKEYVVEYSIGGNLLKSGGEVVAGSEYVVVSSE